MIQQIIDNAFCEISQAYFQTALGALEEPVRRLCKNPLPHFLLPHKKDDLAPMQALAARLGAGATRIIILGTGGASLGAQVLAQIHGCQTPGYHISAGQISGPQLIFADNLDAESFDRLLAGKLEAVRFLVVSKSGNTVETMMQLGGVLSALQAGGLPIGAHLAGIAGTQDNALRQLATQFGFELLDHEDDIGGRFSVLTNAGLLPAIWSGSDPQAVREGAASVIADVMASLHGDAPAQCSAVVGAAAQWAHMRSGRMISVIMPYADRLDRLAFWYRQLWAESLGKQGHGSLPVNALGPVDQHSQLQLYLDGPDDKFFTLLSHPTCNTGPGVPAAYGEIPGLADLAGRRMGDLVDAEARATLDTLAGARRPVRHIRLRAIDDATLGALLMHFMLETILTAELLGVNAFDQPTVEQGKIRTLTYMQDMA